jgi:hypothetical protein
MQIFNFCFVTLDIESLFLRVRYIPLVKSIAFEIVLFHNVVKLFQWFSYSHFHAALLN